MVLIMRATPMRALPSRRVLLCVANAMVESKIAGLRRFSQMKSDTKYKAVVVGAGMFNFNSFLLPRYLSDRKKFLSFASLIEAKSQTSLAALIQNG